MTKDLKLALKIMRKADKLLRKKYQQGKYEIHIKKGNEIVTSTDRELNKLITNLIKKYFPQDNIVSEEAERQENSGKKTWYIDPLDGTSNFSYGLPEFGICLARTNENNDPDIGLISLPNNQEIYYTEKNSPSFLNGKIIKVSKNIERKDGRNLLFACDGHSKESNEKFAEIVKNMNQEKLRLRVIGVAGIELSAVACGRADACYIPTARSWDVLAGVLLVKNAGGKTTNRFGKKWSIGDDLISSNEVIHENILKLVE